jgi:hypothetical protein
MNFKKLRRHIYPTNRLKFLMNLKVGYEPVVQNQFVTHLAARFCDEY